MNRHSLLIRSVLLVTGLFVMAVGVALSIKAHLGTSPISCIPYVFSLKFPVSVGTASIVMNVILILLQMVLLRRDYEPIQLLQFPVALIFGVFIDCAMALLSGLSVSGYAAQLSLCLLSCTVLAVGVFLEVKARLTYLAGEGLSIAVSRTFNIAFGKAKTGVDCTLVFIGIISSFLLLGRLCGIREGTIAAAVLVGTITRFLCSKIGFIDSPADEPA